MPTFVIRQVALGDLEELDALMSSLDDESRTRRWFSGATDIHKAAAWAANPDHRDAVGLVAETVAGRLVGHAALVRIDDERAEVCFEVAAAWRHHGIAGRLLAELDRQAVRREMTCLVAEVLAENRDMLGVFHAHGPCIEHRDGFGVVEIAMPIGDPIAQPAT
jgi:GNAT superfamily N-acetyltransferase